MSIFSRRLPYDRKRMLAQADALAAGRRWRRALRLYRQVLAAEPRNPEIHFRAAPLFARAGLPTEAWESFRIATEASQQAGQEAQLLSLHRQAVKALPRSFEACRELARVERAQNKRDAALRTLIGASHRLRRRRTRGQAILLLRDARQIESWHPEVVVSLCRLLRREGQAAEALFLLDHLEQRVSDHDLLSVRSLCWQIEPSVRHSWRWFCAWRELRRTARQQPRRARA